MAKPMNHKRRLRALESKTPAVRRNPLVLHLVAKQHRVMRLDKKKQASKTACRGRS
jgi:hypothetical protein